VLTGVKHDLVMIAMVLPVCGHLVDLYQGMEIHNYIIRNKFQYYIYVHNAFIGIYTKCIPFAEWIWEESLKRLWQMLVGVMKPNDFSVAIALTSCASLPSMEHGMSLHILIIETRLDYVLGMVFIWLVIKGDY
jgi:hypothetical protein